MDDETTELIFALSGICVGMLAGAALSRLLLRYLKSTRTR